MFTSLFRQQAINHQQNRLQGEVMVIPSFPFVLMSLFVFVWVGAVIIWLTNSQYARKETVSGWLEPPTGIVKVFPEHGQGRIKKVLVKQGDHVDKGHPLLVIDGDRFLTNGNSLETTLIDEYQQQRQILQHQLVRSENIHSLKMDDVRAQIHASKDDLGRLEKQIVTLKLRHDLQQKRFDNYSTMYASGHLSDIEMDNSHQQLLSIKNEQQQLLRDEVNLNNRISQLSTQLLLAPQQYQNEQTQLRAKISELTQQIEQINGQRSHVLTASRPGVITNLQAIEGQRVKVNNPLLTILPVENEIEAKLLIPVRAIGFVQPKQSIEIRYDAFPYQKFGLYRGQITEVSGSVILPGELNSSPIPIREPVYMVHARLAEQFVSGYGLSVALKSGMTLSADIKLADRSILEWLFEPIYSLQGKL